MMKLKLILTTAIVGMVVSLLGAAAAARADPFAYVPNSFSFEIGSSDSVFQYDIGAGGLLAPLSPATVAAGDTPFAAAVSPDGQSAYVTNIFSDNVSQYDIGAGGALSPKNPATVAAGADPNGVAVSPDGGSVYVANGASDPGVSQYDVGAGGALSPKSPATVVTGGTPQQVAVTPAQVPASKDQCKNGGWRNVPQFKNQGQCIAFVDHGP
jgi:DNA-binding beta-propeller fold protein YncE